MNCDCQIVPFLDVMGGRGMRILYCNLHRHAEALFQALRELGRLDGGGYCFCRFPDEAEKGHSEDCRRAREVLLQVDDSMGPV